MGDPKSEKHPSAADFVDYFGGRLTSERETEVDLHLSSCDDCAMSASRVRLLSHVVAGWSAAGHRSTAAESRIVRALKRAYAAPACAAWQERLSRWEGWAGRSEAALRVIMRQAGDSVLANVSGLVELTRSGALWPEFVPQAVMCGAMATRGALEETDAVVSASEDAPRVRVAAQAADGRIEVEVEGVPVGQAPLVMLVPDDATVPVLLGQLGPGPMPSRFVAVFEKVALGRYTLVIEPLVNGTPSPGPTNLTG